MSKYTLMRHQANQYCLEWLRTLVPDGEDRDRLTLDNFEQFLPDETHYYANGQIRIHAMTPKWFYKQLKKNPEASLQELINGAS